MRNPSRVVFLALVGAAIAVTGCSSPNRGHWAGSFEGSVAGTVEFTIDTRGSNLTGTMTGKTEGGEDFHASMKGSLSGMDLVAEFEGSATTDFRPVPFNGVMKGQLLQGKSHGSWECTLRFTDQRMTGTWQADQTVAVP